MPQPAKTYNSGKPELRTREWPRKPRIKKNLNIVGTAGRARIKRLSEHAAVWIWWSKPIASTLKNTSAAKVTNLSKFLAPIPPVLEDEEKRYSELTDREITVTSGLAFLLSDSWATIRRYTISWVAAWGALVQLVAWLLGGFDAELRVTTALVIIFLLIKALVHLQAGEFGMAFWRILHFPLWMLIIAIGTLADLSHAESAISCRTISMLFVNSWCIGGSTTTVLKLLGLKRVEQLRRGIKKLIRETFAEDDGESDGFDGR
jgi:hypothetical protein